MTHISWKSHQNGANNPRAHLRKAIPKEAIAGAPIIAYPLGLFDCCGVSDGSAMAIVTTPEIARKLKPDQDLGDGEGPAGGGELRRGGHVRHMGRGQRAHHPRGGQRAYKEAGITDPREEISMMEVHDCFSITELCTMEDLDISPEGGAVDDVLNGFFDLHGGGVPCQVDGGLKCFGHPIGASGLRMLYEMYNQLLQRWPEERLVKNPKFGLTHNLGGIPNNNVCSIAIVGLQE